jgi:tetratricopeptide (TPR) repeat protein
MLRSFIAQKPTDPFPRYALAQELKNTGDLASAWGEYSILLQSHKDYVPAYFHGGGVLVSLGRKEDAKALFQAGISLCERVGDSKTQAELVGALAELS